MKDAYIVAAARTAAGRRNGRLAQWHPTALAASILDEVVRRAALAPVLVDDVIRGSLADHRMSVAPTSGPFVTSNARPMCPPCLLQP